VNGPSRSEALGVKVPGIVSRNPQQGSGSFPLSAGLESCSYRGKTFFESDIQRAPCSEKLAGVIEGSKWK
jgi:hypothetical protein